MYGALVGILLLGLLDAATSSQAAEARAGGIIGAVSKTVQRIVDPSVAAIPDRRKPSSGGGGGGLLGNLSPLLGVFASSTSPGQVSPLVSTKAPAPKPIQQPTISV